VDRSDEVTHGRFCRRSVFGIESAVRRIIVLA